MTVSNRLTLREAAHAGSLRKTAVSHIGFRVPDIEVTTEFYNRVLGLTVHERREDGAIRLGWGAGHHVIELREGEQALLHYGFEVRDENGIDGIRSRLEEAGYDVADLDPGYIDGALGSASGLIATDPDGTPVHFHSAVQRHGENAADTGRRPIKFQHTTVGTVALEPFVEFFVNTIGFRITDQLADGKFAWFRSDKDHHTLAVVEVGRAGDIDHYSYDLAEWADFKAWCDRLTELDVDVAWGPGRHGPGNNLFVFFDDPAGNHIELSAEMEKFYDDTVEYVTRKWEPIPNSVNLWGGQLPSWRKTSEAKQ